MCMKKVGPYNHLKTMDIDRKTGFSDDKNLPKTRLKIVSYINNLFYAETIGQKSTKKNDVLFL